jgi:catechol 2,3-dioxygenase-like lactoylglutathione lyase family enzyme
MQIAFVVPSLDQALEFWTRKMGVGPFVVFADAMKDRQFIYRGRQSAVEVSLAFSYVGDTQIELIAQSNAARSPYLDFLGSGRQGAHHMAYWPEDPESACRDLERVGFEEVVSIQTATGGGIVRYYSGPAHLGLMVEIAPMTPERDAYFSAIQALAQAWDGNRPVRTYASRAGFLASEDCKPGAAA